MEDLTEAYLSVYNDIEEAKTPVTRRSMGIESQFVDKTGEEKARDMHEKRLFPGAPDYSHSFPLSDDEKKSVENIRNAAKAKAEKQASESPTKSAARKKRTSDLDKIKLVDSYDLVLSHLLDEGYCDSQDSAIKMMAAMSQDWIDAIVEEFVDPEHGETPSGRTPLENVADHPKKSVRKKAVAGFKKQMRNQYGGNWKSKSNDAR